MMGVGWSAVLRTWLVAAIVSVVVCWVLVGAAKRWRLTGKPALREKGARPSVPHLGGVGLVLACLAALAWSGGGWEALGHPAWRGWIIGALWLVAIGLIDDLVWELPPFVKGLGQLVAAAMLMAGGIAVEIAYWPGWLNGLATVLWIVGMTNALNLLDILDGLAATVAVIAALAFVVLASWAGQAELALLAAAVTGAVAGFLVFNWSPARLYMGDAGSQWLGFTLAALALAIRYAPLGREVALATPLIVLGLPVYDLVYVVWMRLRRGQSPFRKSRNHLALRAVSEGADPRRAVLAMAGLAFGFALVGLYVSRVQNLAGSVAVALVVLAIALWGRRLAKVQVNA